MFLEYNPHLIVSVHPLMQHVPVRISEFIYLHSQYLFFPQLMSLKRLCGALSRQIPFTTVVTDLTSCHPTWFHKVFSEKIINYILFIISGCFEMFRSYETSDLSSSSLRLEILSNCLSWTSNQTFFQYSMWIYNKFKREIRHAKRCKNSNAHWGGRGHG